MLMTKETFLQVFSHVGIKEDIELEFEKLKEYPSVDMVDLDIVGLEDVLKNLSDSIFKSMDAIKI